MLALEGRAIPVHSRSSKTIYTKPSSGELFRNRAFPLCGEGVLCALTILD